MIRAAFLLMFTLGLLVSASEQTEAARQFETIKSLEGRWTGHSQDGKPVSTSFLVTSGGQAVLQMLHPTGWPEKPTVYHMDGKRVMLTHFCSAGNQPRMAAVSSDGAGIDFKFVDATNLKSKRAGHMSRVVFAFQDAAHFSQAWTWSENGKDEVSTFSFERQKE